MGGEHATHRDGHQHYVAHPQPQPPALRGPSTTTATSATWPIHNHSHQRYVAHPQPQPPVLCGPSTPTATCMCHPPTPRLLVWRWGRVKRGAETNQLLQGALLWLNRHCIRRTGIDRTQTSLPYSVTLLNSLIFYFIFWGGSMKGFLVTENPCSWCNYT